MGPGRAGARGCAKETAAVATDTHAHDRARSGPSNSSVTKVGGAVEPCSAARSGACDQQSTGANQLVTNADAKQLATPGECRARSRELRGFASASSEPRSSARVSQPAATASTVRANGGLKIRSEHFSASVNQFNYEPAERGANLIAEQQCGQDAQVDQRGQQPACGTARDNHRAAELQDATPGPVTSERGCADSFISGISERSRVSGSARESQASNWRPKQEINRSRRASRRTCRLDEERRVRQQQQQQQQPIKDACAAPDSACRSLDVQQRVRPDNLNQCREQSLASVENSSFWTKLSNLSRSIIQQQQSDLSTDSATHVLDETADHDIGEAFLAPEVVSYLESKRQAALVSPQSTGAHSHRRVPRTNMTKASSKNIGSEEQESGRLMSVLDDERESRSRLREVKKTQDELNTRRRKRKADSQITSLDQTPRQSQQAACPPRHSQINVDGQNVIKTIELKQATINDKMQPHHRVTKSARDNANELELAERLDGQVVGKTGDARRHQVKLSITTNATNTTTTNTTTSTATRSSSASSLSSCILSESLSGQSDEARLKWGKKMDFLLSIIGFAVDLANIWRFPYLVYRNGGGVFLIPYLIMLIFGGIPLFFLELCLGQYVKKGPITVWNKICPYMKGVGYCSILISWYVSFYYNVLIAWSVYFIYRSLLSVGGKMPWEDCDNSWNTASTCVSISQLKELCSHRTNTTLERCRKDMFSAINVTSPASEFFVKELSQIDQSSGLNDMGYLRPELVICTVIVYLLHYLSLFKGLETSGKVVWVTATAPYMILSILLVRGLFLPGASMGIEYYLSPRLEKLADPQVWIDAAGQVFYSIGVGFGVHLTYASFNSHDNNCYRDCLMTSAVNALTSVYSGLVVFVYLGYMATNLGIEIDKVASEGYSLVFEVYPEALTTLPFARFWSILFFIMLLTLGIDSAMGGLEAVITGLEDEFKFAKRLSRGQLTGLVIVSSFLPALISCTQGGAYTLFWFDIYSAGVSLLFSALFETIGVVYCYGLDKFILNIESMLGKRPQFFYIICWKYISPIFLLGIIFMSIYTASVPTYRGYTFPLWSVVLGWCLAFSSVAAVPIVAICTICTNTGGKAPSVSPSKSPRKQDSKNLSRKSTPSLGNQCRKTISTINYSDITQQSGTRATSSVINLPHDYQQQHHCYKEGTKIEEEML